MDFGLSRHDHLPDLLEEEFPLPMGTRPYISPEQIQVVRSDLFALGVMLYHLTTGERPFGNPSSVSGLRRRLYTDPVLPRAYRSETPPWLQEVILRCLEIEPAQRYQTGAQLALDLQHPQQIPLSSRAERMATRGTLSTVKRWFKAMGAKPRSEDGANQHVERSPIIMVAVGIKNTTPALDKKLLGTVRRIMQTAPGARLACASVMKTARIGMDTLVDEQGNSLHVQLLVAIKDWARPLQQQLQIDDTIGAN